jgi:hypothetical protein
MRATFFAVIILASVIQVIAQQESTVSPVSRTLQDMKSRSSTERSRAFETASELLAAGKLSANESDRLKLGIIQLLIAENARANVPDEEALKESSTKASGTPEDEVEDEDYYPRLIGFVVNMDDERTIPALVGAMPCDSDATGALVKFGTKAVGPILDQIKSQNALLRATALSTAITMEGQNESVSPAHIREMLRSALTDPVAVVRSNAVNEIACLGDRQDFVPILKKLAKTDPVHYKGDDGVDGDQFYPVRFDARRALREIQNNERCVWRVPGH